MCHESSGAALTQTIGVGKGTVTLDDIAEHADLIVIVGQNPGTNHPRMLTALEDAKKRGARIVAVNPLPEAGLVKFRNPQTPRGLVGPGTKLADRYLPVRVNGDLALFAGVNRALLEREDAAPRHRPRPGLHRRVLRRLRGGGHRTGAGSTGPTSRPHSGLSRKRDRGLRLRRRRGRQA